MAARCYCTCYPAILLLRYRLFVSITHYTLYFSPHLYFIYIFLLVCYSEIVSWIGCGLRDARENTRLFYGYSSGYEMTPKSITCRVGVRG